MRKPTQAAIDAATKARRTAKWRRWAAEMRRLGSWDVFEEGELEEAAFGVISKEQLTELLTEGDGNRRRRAIARASDADPGPSDLG